jgi:hypothetical protein
MYRITETNPVFNFVLNVDVDSQQPCTGKSIADVVLAVLKVINGIYESR